MHPKLVEQSILLGSLLKWFIIASLIGIIIGCSTTLFLNILGLTATTLQKWPLYFLLLPLGMCASVLLIDYLCPDAEGHGTEAVIDAIHKQSGKIRPSVVPV